MKGYFDYSLGNIFLPSDAESRSISAENPKGEKGKGAMSEPGDYHPARDLGKGWKAAPCIVSLDAESVTTLAEIEGPGLITHIWTTCDEMSYRDCILRFYYDGEKIPSIEVPYGDFFCNGWGVRTNILSMPVNVNPSGGFNSYWPIPFKASIKITVENQRKGAIQFFFYQIDYLLQDIPEDSLYLHAQWRRENPLPYGEEYTIVDDIKGRGRFSGVYIAWGQNNNRWWGEGEVKFYIDGDKAYPTYCGTGTEDYFGGAWCFNNEKKDGYETYSAPYLGYPQLIMPDGKDIANMRHGLYRWHIVDPIFFKNDFKATIQALGWRGPDGSDRFNRYLQLQDDIASTAFWYQTEPHNRFPEFPDRDYREVN
ncbi:MAG: DUF2961 domain-containing protein [Desulfobacteraceae bacterium]|nr:DUF2961 domain-containing protein [Desulfobacteraceae bacterium]